MHGEFESPSALSDLAVVARAAGDQVGAIRAIQQAVATAPGWEPGFQNLVALLLAFGELRDRNLESLWKLLRQLSGTPWARRYQSLFYLPSFLNLEFVSGKCNLKCRMCVGRNADSYPNKLSYITAEKFRAMVQAAPSIAGATLSSGDSDPLLHHPCEGDTTDGGLAGALEHSSLQTRVPSPSLGLGI